MSAAGRDADEPAPRRAGAGARADAGEDGRRRRTGADPARAGPPARRRAGRRRAARPARRRAAGAAAPGGQVRAEPAGPARRRRRSPPSSPPTRCSASGSPAGSSPRPATWARPCVEGACPAAADPVEVAALAYLARPRRLARPGRRPPARRCAPRPTAPPSPSWSATPSSAPPAPSTTARWPGSRPRSCATSWPGVREELGRLREEARRRAKPLRETQAARAQGHRAAGHREGPGRPGRRRPRRRAAPAAGPAGRGRGGRRRGPRRRQGGPRGRRRPAVAAAGDDRAGRRRAAPRAGAGPGRPAAGRLRRRARTPTGRARQPPAARALDADDPARLDQLLALPRGAPGRRRLQRHQARLRRDVAGAAAQPADHRAGRDRRADRRRGHRASSTAPSGCTGCRRRRAACGCCSPARARPPTS